MAGHIFITTYVTRAGYTVRLNYSTLSSPPLFPVVNVATGNKIYMTYYALCTMWDNMNVTRLDPSEYTYQPHDIVNMHAKIGWYDIYLYSTDEQLYSTIYGKMYRVHITTRKGETIVKLLSEHELNNELTANDLDTINMADAQHIVSLNCERYGLV